MTINLITFASLLHKQASALNSHEVILNELEKYFTVRFVNYEDIDKLSSDDFKIIFIATGGVEKLVIQHFESLPRPAILLADGMQNSLAAALEISSWLRNRGMKSEILHGELPSIIKRIQILYNNFQAQRSLYGMRIGVIGTPSSWLVASNVGGCFLRCRRFAGTGLPGGNSGRHAKSNASLPGCEKNMQRRKAECSHFKLFQDNRADRHYRLSGIGYAER